MRRREFILGLTGFAAVQRSKAQDRLRRIGVLMMYSDDDRVGHARLKAFEQSLEKLGWTDGRNVNIEVRWCGADAERTHRFAIELLGSQPDVIVTTSTPTTAAVKQETRTIPTVFTVVADPIGQGFVQSFARPGGNITGFANFEPSMAGKWLALLKDIDPRLVRAAGLFNPDAAPDGGSYFYRAFEAAARDLAITPFVKPVRTNSEIDSAISAVGQEPGAGLVLMADSFMAVHRATVIEQAARHRVPAVYPFRSAVAEGGLFSYGPDVAELYRQVAPYVDRLLRGAQPSGLPVQAPTKFELVINLQTAKSLGLDVPPTLLTRADEVIE
jgi:putative ABC transport system substrate-binding protein